MSKGEELGRQIALGLKAAEGDVAEAKVAFAKALEELQESVAKTPLRYIHERKPNLRWWRRILGRWGR